MYAVYFWLISKLVNTIDQPRSMSRKLKLLSLDVRGLSNVNKRRTIFSYLKIQKATIFCLQETYSSPEDEKLWSAKWGASIIYSHGTTRTRTHARTHTHTRGVCILLNPSSPFNLSSIHCKTFNKGEILFHYKHLRPK